MGLGTTPRLESVPFVDGPGRADRFLARAQRHRGLHRKENTEMNEKKEQTLTSSRPSRVPM